MVPLPASFNFAKVALKKCSCTFQPSTVALGFNRYSNSVCGQPLIKSPFDNPNRVLCPADLQNVPSNVRLDWPGPGSTLHSTTTTSAGAHQTLPPQPPPPPSSGSRNQAQGNGGDRRQPDGSTTMGDVERRRLMIARNTKYGLLGIVGSGLVFFIGSGVYYAFPKHDPSGQFILDEYSQIKVGWLWRMIDGFRGWRTFLVEPANEKLLPDPVKPPWHQPKYTVVMEIRNVLVHPEWDYKRGHHFIKRPAVDYFLEVSGYPNFELVVYTSESLFTAPVIIESLDRNHRIMYRLFRNNTKTIGTYRVKDLSRLNRDMSKVIYIDWDAQAAQLNPENTLLVPKWDGRMDDTALLDLAELLKTIHLSDIDDVRPILQHYNQFSDPMAEFRRRATLVSQQQHSSGRANESDQPKLQQQPDDHRTAMLKPYTGTLFGYRRHAV